MSKSRKHNKIEVTINDPEKAALLSLLSVESKMEAFIDMFIDDVVERRTGSLFDREQAERERIKIRESFDAAMKSNLELKLEKLKKLGI